NEIGGLRVADEISLPTRVAPSSLRIPMPCFNEQFCVLPITYCLPTSRERLLHDRLGEKFIGRSSVDAIDAGAQSLGGNKGLDDMAGRGIYTNSLRKRS